MQFLDIIDIILEAELEFRNLIYGECKSKLSVSWRRVHMYRFEW